MYAQVKRGLSIWFKTVRLDAMMKSLCENAEHEIYWKYENH